MKKQGTGRAKSADLRELTCGCEVLGDWDWVSKCVAHRDEEPELGLYICGECGFGSFEFERLERHVYVVHLGVRQ